VRDLMNACDANLSFYTKLNFSAHCAFYNRHDTRLHVVIVVVSAALNRVVPIF